MALTQIKTDAISDDAVTLAKQAAGTDGQIITYDASGNPTAVGPGTDGQVLTSTGAGSPPAFETLPTSGATLSGSTNNTVVTVTGSNAMIGETNLTFDGTDLGVNSGRLQTYSQSGGAVITSYASGANGGGIELGANTNTDGGNSGSIFFVNNTNSDATALNSAGSKVVAMQRAVIETSDSNAGDDSGADLSFWTKGEGSGNTEKLRITSSGKVGIGTTGPLKALTVKAASNTHGLYIAADNQINNGWGFQTDSSTGHLMIDRSIDNNFGYRRLTVHGDGGICFQGDTSASNALDDYEEGTWTITGSNSITISDTYNTGHYIKIGKLVHCHGMLQVLDGNSNSHFGFHVPFAAGNLTDSAERSLCSCGTHNWNLPTDEGNVYGTLSSSTTQVNFFMSRDNNARVDLLAYGSAFMDFSLTYTVA